MGSTRWLLVVPARASLFELQFGVDRGLEFGKVRRLPRGQTLDDAAAAPKTINWILELAYRLRQASAAPYSWIAKTLRMGAASSVRAALSRRLQQPAG